MSKRRGNAISLCTRSKSLLARSVHPIGWRNRGDRRGIAVKLMMQHPMRVIENDACCLKDRTSARHPAAIAFNATLTIVLLSNRQPAPVHDTALIVNQLTSLKYRRMHRAESCHSILSAMARLEGLILVTVRERNDRWFF